MSVLHSAEDIYLETISKNRFDFWLSDKQCLSILVKNGLCTADIDSNLKAIETRIEDLQVTLYESLLRLGDQKQVRTELGKVKDKRNSMIEIRHSLDYLTLKGFAEMVKRQYLSFCTLYDHTTNQKIWNSFDDVDYFTLDKILEYVGHNIITVSSMRYLARHEPWRSYWNISKNPFDKPSLELTDEQRTLVLYSKMYDSAYEHPDCPPEDVMDDDDMFDGWLIKQKRERDKDKTTKQVENRFGKHQDKLKRKPGEFFIPVKNKEQAKKINDLNTVEAKIIKGQRKNIMKRKPEVKDTEFLDVKIDLQAQRNKQYIDRINKGKGKK